MIRLAIYHPQIPQNSGTLLRLSACLGFEIDIIKPLGFVFSDKKLKRSAMDYITNSSYMMHDSFDAFLQFHSGKRMIAMDVKENSVSHYKFKYLPDDILIVGSEHSGFLDDHIARIPFSVRIPMKQGMRSINMAIAATIVIAEAFSQNNLYGING